MSFTIKHDKKELISHEDMLSLGWQDIKESLKLTNEKMQYGYSAYGKDNYITIFRQEGFSEIMMIIARDPIKIEWLPFSPENFKIMTKKPTKEAFQTLIGLI